MRTDAELSITGEGPRAETVRVDVKFLPEYFGNSPMAGRSDLKAGRKVGALYDTQDLEAAVRQFAKVPGAYHAAAYVGRDVVRSEVFFVESKGQSLVIGGNDAAGQQTPAPASAPVAAEASAPQVAPVAAPVQELNNATSAVRGVKDLMKELAPPAPAAPTITQADVEAAVERAAAKAVEQFKQQQAAAPVERPKTLAEQLNEMADAREAMRKLTGEQLQPREQPDPFESFATMFEKVRDMQDMVSPSSESQGAIASFFKMVDSVVKNADKLLPIVARFTGAPPPYPQTAQAGAVPASLPAPPAHPADAPAGPAQTASDPLAPVLRLLVDDCTSDGNANRAADAIESLAGAHPEYAPMLMELLNKSSVELLELLSQMTGAHWLLKLPHGISFCDELKAELHDRAKPEDGEPDAGFSIIDAARAAPVS